MPELDDVAVTRWLDEISADPASQYWRSPVWIDQARARLTDNLAPSISAGKYDKVLAREVREIARQVG
jgi:hypothetical protein